MSDFGKITILIASVLSVAVFALHEARAAVKPVRPEVCIERPQKPIDRETGTVPCIRPPERQKTSWWMLVGPNGEVLIIGEYTVRRRC